MQAPRFMEWKEAISCCERLAARIDYRPDIIIGLGRGGLVPARILSDLLGVEAFGYLGMKAYHGIGKTFRKPRITQDLCMDVEGKHVLIVDDGAGTGKSLRAAKSHLKRKGAASIRTAVIHADPSSSCKPDYSVMSTSAWVIYPWERKQLEALIESERLT